MTAEQSSGSPKRVVRRRTKKVEGADSGELRESGKAESQSAKPLIEDVLDEIAAVRAETEGFPTKTNQKHNIKALQIKAIFPRNADPAKIEISFRMH